MRFLFIFLSWIMISFASLQGAETLLLRDNLQHAKPGDYLVVSAGKTQTLFHIYAKKNHILTIEEVAVPESKKPSKMTWKEWINQGAPGNSSWVMFDIDSRTGQMLRYYSFTKKNWFEIPDADNFLSKLLNLKFSKLSDKERKKIGPKMSSGPDLRPTWHPRLNFEGKTIEGAQFNAWRAKWPHDGSDLSGRTIEVYLPKEGLSYPAYFPYWLQITGAAGKAKIRIIDTGTGLSSPRSYPTSEVNAKRDF